jgi:hypothetical protein
LLPRKEKDVKLTRVAICFWVLTFQAAAFSHGGSGVPTAALALPNPVLVFMGSEDVEAGGKKLTRYKFAVDNRGDYPDALFAAAPELPPCGQNTKASRTWIDLYDQSGKRLNGFCALGSRDGLSQIWFALERDSLPPSWVYVEMTDRKTDTKYKSNLAETTL